IFQNFEFDTNTVNIKYDSMLHPQAVFAYRVDRKRIERTYYWANITGYKAENYRSKRLWATAKDGARVPISIIYPKGYREQKDKRLFMYAYGAYGSALSPYFSPYRLSLLDRGIAYAIAHVRGGGELGPDWHAAGARLSRKNSFEDFVAAANHLIEEGYAEKGRIAISGLSAGSTITGYVLNEYPGMWRAAILHSPFVDVLNTMLDPDLQLTPLEWTEWGNPIKDKKVFEYMQSYSQPLRQHPPTKLSRGACPQRA
ncbi:MAG: prolyl oligopeptidase family serine peptidase, partial [Sphingomonadales bacterium]